MPRIFIFLLIVLSAICDGLFAVCDRLSHWLYRLSDRCYHLEDRIRQRAARTPRPNERRWP